MGTSFLHRLTQKIVIFRGFSKKISELLDSKLKFLKLIEFPNILHWKPAKKNQIGCGLGAKVMSIVVKKVKKQVRPLGFFHILLGITF